mmetsp:Transcript_20060/g.46721  ORF Transcript_20060/g.46721 Transcript_20060/m.46721 type:complete len:176 (+) Transcript_20060:113-640(+)
MGNALTNPPTIRPSAYLQDAEVEQVRFAEKAVLATPLPDKAWLEFVRWNPLSLVIFAPVWSYVVAGSADHWWFVARDDRHQYFYVAQFCCINGKCQVLGGVFLDMPTAVEAGLRYGGASWWYAKDWAPCEQPRTKKEMDALVRTNPSLHSPYSWAGNNCQHFCATLHTSGTPHSA